MHPRHFLIAIYRNLYPKSIYSSTDDDIVIE